VGEIAFEVENVPNIGSAPAIDRLIGVADDAEIGIIDRQTTNDCILGKIGVLIFIDQDKAVTRIQVGTQLGIVLKSERGKEKQIVEIDRIRVPQAPLVERINAGYGLSEKVHGLAAVPFRCLQLVLGPADSRFNSLGRKADVVNVRRFQGLFDQANPVLLVVDRKVPVDVDAIGIA